MAIWVVKVLTRPSAHGSAAPTVRADAASSERGAGIVGQGLKSGDYSSVHLLWLRGT